MNYVLSTDRLDRLYFCCVLGMMKFYNNAKNMSNGFSFVRFCDGYYVIVTLTPRSQTDWTRFLINHIHFLTFLEFYF